MLQLSTPGAPVAAPLDVTCRAEFKRVPLAERQSLGEEYDDVLAPAVDRLVEVYSRHYVDMPSFPEFTRTADRSRAPVKAYVDLFNGFKRDDRAQAERVRRMFEDAETSADSVRTVQYTKCLRTFAADRLHALPDHTYYGLRPNQVLMAIEP